MLVSAFRVLLWPFTDPETPHGQGAWSRGAASHARRRTRQFQADWTIRHLPSIIHYVPIRRHRCVLRTRPALFIHGPSRHMGRKPFTLRPRCSIIRQRSGEAVAEAPFAEAAVYIELLTIDILPAHHLSQQLERSIRTIHFLYDEPQTLNSSVEPILRSAA